MSELCVCGHSLDKHSRKVSRGGRPVGSCVERGCFCDAAQPIAPARAPSPPCAAPLALDPQAFIDFFGPSPSHGLYIQYRVFDYRDGINYPLKKFWSDKYPLKVNPDKVYFFSPALRMYGQNYVVASRVLWLDFDCGLPASWHVRPSLVVSTGGGYHAYWRLDDFLDDGTLPGVLDRLFRLYPTADPVARDSTRFLRLLGSNNLKFTPARPVVIHDNNTSVVYSLRDVVPFH